MSILGILFLIWWALALIHSYVNSENYESGIVGRILIAWVVAILTSIAIVAVVTLTAAILGFDGYAVFKWFIF